MLTRHRSSLLLWGVTFVWWGAISSHAIVSAQGVSAQGNATPTTTAVPPPLAKVVRCGAAAVDVTPTTLPVIRNGGFLEATDDRVIDPLHARCLVIERGAKVVALVIVDSCMLPLDVCDEAKGIAARATGIAPADILISATHTHNAPSVMDYCLGSRSDPTYRPFLPGKIAESIVLAHQNLLPARIGWTRVDASRFTKCRRWITRSDRPQLDPFGELSVLAMMHPGHLNPDFVGPSGPIDPWLTLLAVQNGRGDYIAVLANFSMHYFGGHAGVSADYYGRFATLVESQLQNTQPDADKPIAIMSQGTSGDLWWGDYSRPPEQKGFEDIDQYSSELAGAAITALDAIAYHDDVPLEMAERRLTMARRTPSPERLAWAERMNRLRGDRAPEDRTEVYAMQARYLHDNPAEELVLQAVRIGDLGITAMPNEVYGLTGLKLKRQSPLPLTMNVSLANGASGYIPPPEQHALGGYNTWPARTAGLEVGAEPKLVAVSLELLEQVSQQPRQNYSEPETDFSRSVRSSEPFAYWRLDDMQGPTARDATDHGHQLRVSGNVAYHLPGREGPSYGAAHDTHAWHLAGGKLVAKPCEIGENYTVECFFSLGTPSDFRAVTAVLMSRGSDEVTITGSASQTPGRLASGAEIGKTVLEPNRWYHLAFVRNGDFVQIYLDQALSPEISFKTELKGPLPNQLVLGGNAANTANLEGKLDEIAVFQRAVDSHELQLHFSARLPKLAEGTQRDLQSGPLDPQQSMRQIHVRDGFRIELVAAEPLVQDPVAIDWGADGRLWVAEMADYPLGIDGNGRPGGRIRVLRDTDGNGGFDRSDVFLEDVGFPNGIMAWRNGVLVTAAPEIFYAEDTDGDGVADQKETLISGFMEGNQQLRVNGLRWGLDNWVHCANGGHHAGFGASNVVFAMRAQSAVPLGSRDFRFEVDSGRLEPLSGPSQFGRVRDDWGNWFGVQNSQPLWHYVLPDRYTSRNAQAVQIDPRRQIRPPMPRVYSAKPPQKRFHGFDHAGHYTSACGISIYRDDLLFPSAEMHAFTCEPFHNLVQHHVLTEDGTSFSGERADDGPIDFFASADRWTRPVMSRTGPDGGLWIVDMYRYMIEHPQWLPEYGKEELRPGYRAGEGMGRIYRILPADKPPRSVPRLDHASSQELCTHLGHPNGLIRDLAHRQLLQIDGEIATAPLAQMVRNHHVPQTRLQALCLLDGLGQCEEALLMSAMRDEHAAVRRHAIRIAEQFVDSIPLLSAMTECVGDADAKVRLQLACSLGMWNQPAAGQALLELAVDPACDDFLLAAINSALPSHLDGFVRNCEDHPGQPLPAMVFEALLSTADSNPKALSRLLGSIPGMQPRSVAYTRLARWLDSLRDRGTSLAERAIASPELQGALLQMQTMMEEARQIAQRETVPTDDRLAAIELLGREPSRFEEDVLLLISLVSTRESRTVQLGSVQAMLRIGSRDATRQIVAAWPNLLPETQREVIAAMLRQTESTLALLEGIREGQIAQNEFTVGQQQQLITSKNSSVAEQAQLAFSQNFPRDRPAVLHAFQGALSLVGKAERGTLLFRQHCQNCHVQEPGKTQVGPDLRSVTDRSPAALLEAILAPNLSVEPKYQSATLLLRSGEAITGIVSSEGENSITLVDAQAEVRTVVRASVDQVHHTGQSLMPEGFETRMDPQEIADLIAFVQTLGL